MLYPTPAVESNAQEKPNISVEKVTCFVCKKEVEKEHSKQLPHSREKKVWVCETHIK